MAQGIFYCEFKLKKGTNEADFLQAAKILNDEHICKQPGYVGWRQVRDGDTWADLLIFETLQDVKNFEANAATPNELALKFYSFINMPSCRMRYYETAATHGNA
ncbi:MAG: hypothetical protein FWC71_08495 [Defluviitaleaceae bacterium]|nr:hypothetical protein [Defluviitaleaceae bacterium]